MSKIISIGILAAVFFCLIVLQMVIRGKRPVQYALGGIAIGFCALAAVNLSGWWFTGVSLPLSLLTLGVSGAGGVPGVTAMLVLNLFFV